MLPAYPDSYYTATAKGLKERPSLAESLDCDVCVVGFGSRFADDKMGVSANVEPDAEARSVHDFEYALLRALASGELPKLAR